MKLVLFYIVAIATYHVVVAEELREAVLRKIKNKPTKVQEKFCLNTNLCAPSNKLTKHQQKNGILGWEARGFKSQQLCTSACLSKINTRCGDGHRSVIVANDGGDTQKPKYFQRCIAPILFHGGSGKNGKPKDKNIGKGLCQTVGLCHSGGKKNIAGVQTKDYRGLGFNSLKLCTRKCISAYKKHCNDISISGRKGTNLKPTVKCILRNMEGNTYLMEMSDDGPDELDDEIPSNTTSVPTPSDTPANITSVPSASDTTGDVPDCDDPKSLVGCDGTLKVDYFDF